MPAPRSRALDIAGSTAFGVGLALGLFLAPACMALPSFALIWIGFAVRMRHRPVVGVLGGFLIAFVCQGVGLAISENLYHITPFGAD